MKIDHLTARQHQIARLVADGLTDKQIGTELGIATRTANAHVLRIAQLWHLDPAKNLRVLITQRLGRTAA